MPPESPVPKNAPAPRALRDQPLNEALFWYGFLEKSRGLILLAEVAPPRRSGI